MRLGNKRWSIFRSSHQQEEQATRHNKPPEQHGASPGVETEIMLISGHASEHVSISNDLVDGDITKKLAIDCSALATMARKAAA
jgi:hypothetical protein